MAGNKSQAEIQGEVLRNLAASIGVVGAKPVAVADARGKLTSEEQTALDKSLNGMSDYGKTLQLSDMQLNQRLNDYLSHAGPATLRDFSNRLGVNLTDVYSRNGMVAPVDSLGAFSDPNKKPVLPTKQKPNYKEKVVQDSDQASSQLKDLLNQITTKVNPVARQIASNSGVVGAVASGVDSTLKDPKYNSGLSQLISNLTKSVKKIDSGKKGSMEDDFVAAMENSPTLKGIFGDKLPFNLRNPEDRRKYVSGLFSPSTAPRSPVTGRRLIAGPAGEIIEVDD